MRRGFGSRVIERMIGQLKGKTRLDWRAEGLVCEITLRVKSTLSRASSRNGT
jgi:two-component sensor histidine kinase